MTSKHKPTNRMVSAEAHGVAREATVAAVRSFMRAFSFSNKVHFRVDADSICFRCCRCVVHSARVWTHPLCFLFCLLRSFQFGFQLFSKDILSNRFNVQQAQGQVIPEDQTVHHRSTCAAGWKKLPSSQSQLKLSVMMLLDGVEACGCLPPLSQTQNEDPRPSSRPCLQFSLSQRCQLLHRAVRGSPAQQSCSSP